MRRFAQNISLRAKLLVGIVGIVLLLGLTIIFFVKNTLSQRLHGELEKRGVSIARNMALGSTNFILTERTADLQMLINDFMDSEADVEYAFVQNERGAILAHTFQGGFPVGLKDANTLGPGKSHAMQHLVTEKGTVLDIAAPVLKGEAGVVRLGISGLPIQRSINNIVGYVLGIITVILLSGAGISIVFAKRLTDPLYELVETARAVGRGDLAQKVNIKTSDEIGTLGSVFNQMTESLSRTLVSKETLELEREKLLLLYENNPDSVVVLDTGRRIIYGNKRAEEIAGVPLSKLKGGTCFENVIGRDKQCDDCRLDEVISEKRPAMRVKHEVTVSGRENWLHQLWYPIVDSKGNVDSVVEIARDITEQKYAEEQLQSTEKTLQTIINSMPYGVIIIGRDKKVQSANRAALALMGYESEEQVVGITCHNTLCPAEEGNCPIIDLKGTIDRSERILITKDGRRVPILKSVVPVELDGKDVLLEAVIDISERKQAEEQIRILAYYDNLTGLPNRTFFKEILNRTLVRARRRQENSAILIIDIDNFKRINDTLGHTVGDHLLKAAAEKLSACIRKTDSVARLDEDQTTEVVSRLGGDEFVVLLSELVNAQDAVIVAQRMLNDLSRPIMVGDREVFLSASIGISLCPSDGEDVDTLLKNADAAMSHAKSRGSNSYQFYEESMNAAALKRLTLEGELRRAMEHDEFLVHYQPKLDVPTRKITGMEALVRWQHPERGLVSPADFIPLAEETGLIVPIGEWVLRTACAQNKAWQDAGFEPLSVSVNLSSRQFEQQNLTGAVTAALHDTGLAAQYLELEITESMLMRDPEETIMILQAFENKGIRISIDDFGTGYSSLSYLNRFPLDYLKIDRAFVMNITTNPDDAAITTAIVAMAHSLKLKVIAEGVETEEQLAFLRGLGCDEVQGYLFSRPVPAEKFAELLKSTEHA